MKKFAVVIISISLAIIAFMMSYRLWVDHKRAKEAEAALANMEANKPPRFIAEVPANVTSPLTDSIVVSIDNQGQVKINGEDAGKIDEIDYLRSRLTHFLSTRDNKTVILEVPRAMKYGEVAKLIDEIKKVSGAPVGLQVNES
ncbi:MAG TPA: biopolymer transporter ExbD [Pyrinomonadaceae bacterium]|jgi:biopolymer transport protein ExbD|nr:biopolymer transporter ExbD [Pyrinomonadaceae bacterium]